MTSLFIIDSDKSLPDCTQISGLMVDCPGLILKYTDWVPGYIDELADGLDQFSVMHFYWEKTISIARRTQSPEPLAVIF